ncbi:MAG: prolipoprotein diacylglyceryl transferase family protein [Flavonifractor plautii]
MLRAFVFCYAPVRFVLEWFRGDPARGMYGPLSTSQWLSLVVLALALAWPVAGRKLKKYGRERVSQQKGNRDKSDSAHS